MDTLWLVAFERFDSQITQAPDDRFDGVICWWFDANVDRLSYDQRFARHKDVVMPGWSKARFLGGKSTFYLLFLLVWQSDKQCANQSMDHQTTIAPAAAAPLFVFVIDHSTVRQRN